MPPCSSAAIIPSPPPPNRSNLDHTTPGDSHQGAAVAAAALETRSERALYSGE